MGRNGACENVAEVHQQVEVEGFPEIGRARLLVLLRRASGLNAHSAFPVWQIRRLSCTLECDDNRVSQRDGG